MKSTDFAYAAGYIDGDGCFEVGNQKWGSHFTIVSTKKESINWFSDHIEGTIRIVKPSGYGKHSSYHFRFSKRGLEMLDEISKYLVEKKEEYSVFKQFRESRGKENKKPFIEKMKFLKNKKWLIHNSIKEELHSIRNTITPTLEDFAYLAGFIDAECSLDICRKKQNKNKTFTYTPQIQCNNTKSPFFYWVSQRFGGQFHFIEKSKISKAHRNQFTWRISYKQLDPILVGIHPFLTSKKLICEKMLELRKITITKGRRSPNHPQFDEWYLPFAKAKDSIYEQVRHLNSI